MKTTISIERYIVTSVTLVKGKETINNSVFEDWKEAKKYYARLGGKENPNWKDVDKVDYGYVSIEPVYVNVEVS